MDSHEYLFGLAEMSTVLVGFAAVVMAVKSGGEDSDFPSYTFRGVIERGLFTAMFSFLPALLATIPFVPSGQEFRVASIGLVLYNFYALPRALSWWRSFEGSRTPISSFTFYSRFGTAVLVMLMLIANAWLAYVWVYLIGVSWLFVNACLLILTYVNQSVEDV